MNSVQIKIQLLLQSVMHRTGRCVLVRVYPISSSNLPAKAAFPAFCVTWKLMVNPVSTRSIYSAPLGISVYELTYVQVVNLTMLTSQIKTGTLYYDSLKLLSLNGTEIYLHFSLLNSCCRSVVEVTKRARKRLQKNCQIEILRCKLFPMNKGGGEKAGMRSASASRFLFHSLFKTNILFPGSSISRGTTCWRP